MKKILWLAFLIPGVLQARPLWTETPSTLGPATFEPTLSGAVRKDDFNENPSVTYRTNRFPMRARLGFGKKLDLGFSLTYLSQSLKTGGNRLKGSRPALFSPEIKYSFNKNLGLLAVWHTSRKEKSNQSLPISRGDDYELKTLIKLPTAWPSYINAGYLFRGNYDSRFGVTTSDISKVEPGDIFETSASLEIPLRQAFSILTEVSYFDFGSKKVNGQTLEDSAGTAMDALIGLVWENKGWNIILGTSFGLLDERYTSFDLERGSGDVTFHMAVSYRLSPKKTNI